LKGEGERPIVNVVGERVALGPLRRDLAPLFLRWWNDFGTTNLSGFPDPVAPYNAERLDGWLDGALKDARRAWFVIYEVATWRPIGYANLRDIDHQHGTAEFGITIGDPAVRGKGFGTEATRLVLDYAFTGLGLTNVLLDTAEYNPGAVRAYEKAGFKVIGRRRRAHRSGGRAWDVVVMDCVAEEFVSPVLAGLLAPEREGG
jgi:diamine N-acetyltransferase